MSGVYEQYGFTHVTHVIADNLASGNQTWAQLKRRTKRVNVVTSSWVMDCVKEGRRNSLGRPLLAAQEYSQRVCVV